MVAKKIKDLKVGEFFALKPIEEPCERQVYIREKYDRSDKGYWCTRYDDISLVRFFKGDRLVYVDFTF